MKRTILFLGVVILLFFNCKKDEEILAKEPIKEIVYDENSKTPIVLFIVDNKDKLSVDFNLEIKKTINYTKIPYGEVTAKEINSDFEFSSTTKVIIIRDAEILSESAIKNISNFIALGNTLIITNTPSSNKAGFLYGTKKFATLKTDNSAKGIYFNKKMLPTFYQNGYEDESVHFGLTKDNFNTNLEVLATAYNQRDYPLIIRNKIVDGQVIFFNSTMYALKYNRGILFSSILSGLSNIPYPIANVSSIHLDDFPAPLYKIKKEPIFSEMDLYQDDFYQQIWWPDMLALADKYKLKYTTFPAFDYSGKITPPFLFEEWNLNMVSNKNQLSKSDVLMSDVSNKNHELGFHGYNHTSLLEEEWPNAQIMALSLKTVIKRWKTYNYTNLPVSYVPPTNLIDSLGINVLHQTMPSISILSSLYLGEFKIGEGREFDEEPYNKALFDFPRISSGYDVGDKVRFADYSTFLYTGISNHFLHPDDVFQVKANDIYNAKGNYKYRNNKNLGWRSSKNGKKGMLSYYEEYLKQKLAVFPLLKSYTTKDAVKLVKDWRKQKVNFNIKDSLITVTSNSLRKGDFYWFVYVKSKDILSTENTLNKQGLSFSKTNYFEGKIFQIKTTEPKISLFKDEVNNNLQNLEKDVAKEVRKYESETRKFKSKREAVDFYIANSDITKAINLQKQKIKKSSYFNENDWLKLNQLFSWNSQPRKTWAFLEEQFLVKKENKAIKFSKKLTELNYPELKTRKIWLIRQIEEDPKNTSLKEEYNSYFKQENFSKLNKQDLLNSLKNSSSVSDKLKYYQLLIFNYPETAIQLFENKTPCLDKEIKKLAREIAWLFANQKKYGKALEWSKCTNEIPFENLKNWRINNGEYEFLKQDFYVEYIQILLQKNPSIALAELDNETPCRNKKLEKLHAQIAYSYGNLGKIRKALAWANCTDNFLLSDKMLYNLQLNNTKAVEDLYTEGEINNKITDLERLVLIESYLQTSQNVVAFRYAAELSNSEEQRKMRKRLNEIIFYESIINQELILEKYNKVLYDENIIKLKKEIRLKKDNSIEFNANLLTDKLIPTSFSNQITYNIRDKKDNKHSISLTEYSAYALNLPFTDPNNFNQNFYGIHYGFKSKQRYNKLNYTASTSLETNNKSDLFYHINIGANLSKNNLYSSLQIAHQPAITSPAYSLNIYRTQLAIYEELNFKKRYQAIASLVANNFSDNEQDILLMLRFGFKLNQEKRNNYTPFIETAGMVGTTNNGNGFPYWTIDKRIYSGGGINYRYKNEISKFEVNLNSAAFIDTFSGQFLRYGGNLNYPISDYFILTGSAEFFTLRNFYSNNFRFGLKYYLK